MQNTYFSAGTRSTFLSLRGPLLAGVLGVGVAIGCGSPAKPKDAPSGTSNASADSGAPMASGLDDAGQAPATGSIAAASDAGAAPTGSTDTPPSSAKGDIHTDDADDACATAAAALEKRARPQIKACYREGKKKDANLIGGVRLAAAVTPAGKLGNVLTSPNGDKKLLPPAVVKCMVEAVKAADPGDISACKGKSLAIPVQFPSQ